MSAPVWQRHLLPDPWPDSDGGMLAWRCAGCGQWVRAYSAAEQERCPAAPTLRVPYELAEEVTS